MSKNYSNFGLRLDCVKSPEVTFAKISELQINRLYNSFMRA